MLEPEVRQTQTGKTVAKVCSMVVKSYGEDQQKTCGSIVEAWENLANNYKSHSFPN